MTKETIMRDELLALAERVEAGAGCDNALDCEIEIASFKPDTVYVAVRQNAAGTKVIYTDRSGNELTCWPDDWTMRRSAVAAALRARATQGETDQ